MSAARAKPVFSPGGVASWLRLISIGLLLGWLCGISVPSALPGAEPPPSELHASGRIAHRWRVGDRDFTLLRGDCTLRHKTRSFFAESILLVEEGKPNEVTVRLLIDRMELGGGKVMSEPYVAKLDGLSVVPTIEASKLQSRVDLPPDWLARLHLSLSDAISQPMSSFPSRLPTTSSMVSASQSGATRIPSSDLSAGVVEPVQYGTPLNTPQLLSAEDGLSLPMGGMSLENPYPDPTLNAPTGQPSLVPPVTSFAPPATELPPPPISTPDGGTTGGWQLLVGNGTRSIELLKRGASQPAQAELINRVETNESIAIARGGVTVLIRDVTVQSPAGDAFDLGTVSISANRIVAWLPLMSDLLRGTADISSSAGEIYLEGDIVFEQGDRTIYAEAMYYNVAQEVGMVLDAEAITTIPEYQGTVRLKAEVMQQVARGNYIALDAAVTSSRMGVPRYWLQSNRLELSERPVAKLDPATGQPYADSEPFISSGGNFVYMGGVPVLYWPRFTTSLDRPTFYLTGADVKNDEIFGAQVLLEWDLLQLLGLRNPPDGVESILLTDYLSDRGPAIGTRTTYQRPSLFGIAGPVTGEYDSYLIKDKGLDVLGQGRRNLTPEETIRGRTTLRHRHYLPGGWEFIGEIGYLSDRNFLEQFMEEEWDRDVDRTTGFRLRRYAGSQLFDLSANIQVNDFFRETERLPSLNHYGLGAALLGDRLTWSMHNEVGYEHLRVADKPIDPVVAANTATLPGEVDREGVVARTRQEISMPLNAGPVKVIPFAIGEAAHYGEGFDGNELTRLWGGGGIRANLPLSRIDPTVQSSLLNVRGLAHKIDLSAEYFYADSDTNLDDLPYYDPLDDNAQEEFRRFFIFDTFGGLPLPTKFDPRNHALRQGIQRLVTSPSDTVVDDQQQLRLGMKHRFQTKRGLPGRERIVDLLRLDLETILFPNADRDNFGETLGPTMFDAQYNLGDRVTLLSDGYLDFFQDGLRSLSAGVRTSRPGLGDLYVGLLSIEGPISSTVLRGTLDHRLNEKWIVSAGSSYDFGNTGSIGHSFGVTRIGESFLFQLGAKVDSGRDNTSFGFTIEPRFLPSPRLGRLGGQVIPPPGIEGLE